MTSDATTSDEFRSVEAFADAVPFSGQRYDVSAVPPDGEKELFSWTMPRSDEEGALYVPEVIFGVALEDEPRFKQTADALVRGGVRHPGLRDEDLCQIHREAAEHGHVELFTDLNAITTGLLGHLVHSLGRGLARIVIASVSIDILHEYQNRASKPAQFQARARMARALHLLEELRTHVPVHVHQMPPGASRYFRRPGAGTDLQDVSETEAASYVAEDRQMIAAYWDYRSSSSPRVPVILVTSDHSLARVCKAERVPFLFARTPYEAWRRQSPPVVETVWFDAFALGFRACTAHALLWEAATVFQKVNVRITAHPQNSEAPAHFGLEYDEKNLWPGEAVRIKKQGVLFKPAAAVTKDSTAKKSVSRKAASSGASSRDSVTARVLKLRISNLVKVLPTRKGQRLPLARFDLTGKVSLRMLRQVGNATGLFNIDEDEVIAGDSLPTLLDALKEHDYIKVNAIFRQHPSYDELIKNVAQGEGFPSSKKGGALTGWAINLGAAYKAPGGTRYGLAEVTDAQFEEAVVRAHAEIGSGQQTCSLPAIMDRVCDRLQLSPIRFEVLLERSLGQGALRSYEVQRATVDQAIPAHSVLVLPTTAEPESYLRKLEPGRGLHVHGRLVSSLVRREGAAP